MGNLSAAMLAECLRTDRDLHLAIEAALPTGTQWWGPTTGLESAAEGHMEEVVSAFGVYSIGIDPGELSVHREQKQITIEDKDRFWSTLDAVGERLAGSILTTWLGSPRVARASWFELHSGALLPGWSGTVGGRYQLRIDPGAGWLNNRLGVPAREADWVDIPAEDVGKLIPICLGLWDASAGAKKGAVTLRRVSATEYVAFGWLVSIDRVYQAGTLKVETTHYTVDWPVVNGVQYTRVTFGTTPGDDEITADLHGLEDVGDGSGDMITDPTEQLVWILANRGFAQNGQLWDDGTAAPINLASAAIVTAIHADRACGAPCVGSWLLSGDSLDAAPTGWQVLERYAETWEVSPYFGFDGDLHFEYLQTESAYVTTPELRDLDVLPASRLAQRARWSACRSVVVRYGQEETGQTAEMLIRNEAGEAEGERVVEQTCAAGSAR